MGNENILLQKATNAQNAGMVCFWPVTDTSRKNSIDATSLLNKYTFSPNYFILQHNLIT